jgi:PhzF family phenazine biosynthesis protein
MKLYQVDAFTAQPFKGNPAGVCLPGRANMENSGFLQDLANEMNLSETAFLHSEDEEYHLRWFTPAKEVRLCGHATLSAAHIVWELGLESREKTLFFNTLSGRLSARSRGDQIELDFPRYDIAPIADQPAIDSALGVRPIFTGSDGKEYLLEVSDPAELRSIQPDFGKLKAMGHTAFIVTSRSDDPQYDFFSRFFAPAVGIDEDPVTGSSHTRLAPYWAGKLGKTSLVAYQASRRGGRLECELAGSERVLIRGRAVTVFEINLRGY